MLLGRSGTLTQLASMHYGRRDRTHGIVAVLNEVYVFGGKLTGGDEISRKCEKYSLKTCAWQLLPDMREARCNFNPCLWNAYIYLCGEGSSIMEAFNLETQSFIQPFDIRCENSPSCLYVHNNQLMVLSKTGMSKYRAGGQGQLVLEFQAELPAKDMTQCSQPVVDKISGRLFINQDGWVKEYELDTGQQIG